MAADALTGQRNPAPLATDPGQLVGNRRGGKGERSGDLLLVHRAAVDPGRADGGVFPELYSDRFGWLTRKAGLRRISIHVVRHTLALALAAIVEYTSAA